MAAFVRHAQRRERTRCRTQRGMSGRFLRLVSDAAGHAVDVVCCVVASAVTVDQACLAQRLS